MKSRGGTLEGKRPTRGRLTIKCSPLPERGEKNSKRGRSDMSPDNMYAREYQRLRNASTPQRSTQPGYDGLRADHAMVAMPPMLFIPYRSIWQENPQQPRIGRVSFRSQLNTRCVHKCSYIQKYEHFLLSSWCTGQARKSQRSRSGSRCLQTRRPLNRQLVFLYVCCRLYSCIPGLTYLVEKARRSLSTVMICWAIQHPKAQHKPHP